MKHGEKNMEIEKAEKNLFQRHNPEERFESLKWIVDDKIPSGRFGV